MIFASVSQFYVSLTCLGTSSVLIQQLYKEMALIGPFSGHCETSRMFVDASTGRLPRPDLRPPTMTAAASHPQLKVIR